MKAARTAGRVAALTGAGVLVSFAGALAADVAILGWLARIAARAQADALRQGLQSLALAGKIAGAAAEGSVMRDRDDDD